MSTCYVMVPMVSKDQLIKAATNFGCDFDWTHESVTDVYFPIGKDGEWAWVQINEDGNVGNITTWGINSGDFLYDLADSAGVSCYCEHDEEFDDACDEVGDTGLFTITLSDLLENAEPIMVIDLSKENEED